MGMATADAKFHILAVDDNLVERKFIEKVLKSSSFQVTTVDSGCKALEFLGWNEDGRNDCDEASVAPKIHRGVEVDLVLTDYCMPGMSGYDLLKKMKESSSLRNIPVVVMSSENVPSRITRCLEEGAEEFLVKPVRIADVNDKLRPHMQRTVIHENQDNGKFREEEVPLQQNNKRKSSSSSSVKEERTTRARPSFPNNGLTVVSN